MADFQTIHTALGLAAISAAVAAGSPINLTHMGVGDGNGMAVDLSENQTALVRERYRGTVNRVYQSPEHGGAFVAEFVVPASAGGFTMRELGIYTSDGTLFAVGNLPDTYKPAAGSGAFSDAVVRMVFRVSNASIVTLVVDPNVAVVTQQWVTNNITVGWILPGGTTGQYLRKKSNADGDTEWDDALEVTAHVDTIEEHQTLAASQTVVDLAQCTTRGLAIYIDGARLANTEWTADIGVETRLELVASYPAGTQLIAAQNEPSGASGAPLERAKNLSDVENAATARTNLGVYSKTEVDERGRTPGDFVATFAIAAPPRTLKANGALVSRAVYAALFAKIGTTYGAGDGVTTFKLPDARGEFFRGWDDGRGVDVGRAMGSGQGDAIRNITGTFDGNTNDGASYRSGAFSVTGAAARGSDGKDWGGVISFDASRVVPTANENRPRNLALLICIAF